MPKKDDVYKERRGFPLLEIQYALFDYIKAHNIPLKYLDDLVVNQLKLEIISYHKPTPMEKFILSDLNQGQCKQIFYACEEYLSLHKN